ncbi:hypothetical protein L596_029950 [Steinernema carpocapsae]|uniref:WAP domain-containing protein n=1 Tax=Steinernema carpocapsae TaxID=34508 RepID=A0A4U5LRA7_STECR|nr:hypothetical protein L596_029950 [Steinernema carpocapsae]
MKLFLSVLIVLLSLSAAHGAKNTSTNPPEESVMCDVPEDCPSGYVCDAKFRVCLPVKNTPTHQRKE